MRIWHMTADASREPLRVAPGQGTRIVVGSAPIEPEQSVWLTFTVAHTDGSMEHGLLSVPWHHNVGQASYWSAPFGPFEHGDRVTYRVHGSVRDERIELPPPHFVVGPRLYLALLWHQHQPLYLDLAHPPQGAMAQPWVCLHALRGCYSMAAVGTRHPDMRAMFNLAQAYEQTAIFRFGERPFAPADQ